MSNLYETVKDNLLPHELVRVTEAISESDDFEMGELDHIVLKGTETIVGYVGDTSFELYDINNPELKQYHKKLRRLFEEA